MCLVKRTPKTAFIRMQSGGVSAAGASVKVRVNRGQFTSKNALGNSASGAPGSAHPNSNHSDDVISMNFSYTHSRQSSRIPAKSRPQKASEGFPELSTAYRNRGREVHTQNSEEISRNSGQNTSGASQASVSDTNNKDVNTVHGKVAAAVKEMQGALQEELHEDHLQLFRRLACGGFGTVYHGTVSL